MMVSAMQNVWSAVSDVCNRYNVIWTNPIIYGAGGYTIRRGPKYIISVPDVQTAAKAEAELRNALQQKECLVNDYARQKREKLDEPPKKPYSLKVRVINTTPYDTAVVSRTPVIASCKSDKKHVYELNKRLAGAEIASVKYHFADSPDTTLQREINRITDKHHDIRNEIDKKLQENMEYRVSWRKPKVYAFRLNYYDPTDERRHQVSVGDVIIAIGGRNVQESSHRKLRSDRTMVRDDVIMYVWQCAVRPFIPRKNPHKVDE